LKLIKNITIGIFFFAALLAADEVKTTATPAGVESRFQTGTSVYTLRAAAGELALEWRAPAPADRPVADAGEDLSACVAGEVRLTGAGSYDPRGLGLRYEWSIQAKPYGSAAEIIDHDTANCRFTPDLPGEYAISLQITTDDGRGAADQVEVTAEECDYFPRAAISGPGIVCQTTPPVVELSGKGSSGRSEIVRYSWTVEASPAGSSVAPINPGESVQFQLDRPGVYRFGLVVENSLGLRSDLVQHQVNYSDGLPPEILATATRKTFKSLFLAKDTASIAVQVRFPSDCRKAPARYVTFRRAADEPAFGRARMVPAEAIVAGEDGTVSFTVREDLQTGKRYVVLVAGLDGAGAVLSFAEVAL